MERYEVACGRLYTWRLNWMAKLLIGSKEFMESGKRRSAGNKARAATTDEVRDLRGESRDLKICVADLTLENLLLKVRATDHSKVQPQWRMGATKN